MYCRRFFSSSNYSLKSSHVFAGNKSQNRNPRQGEGKNHTGRYPNQGPTHKKKRSILLYQASIDSAFEYRFTF